MHCARPSTVGPPTATSSSLALRAADGVQLDQPQLLVAPEHRITLHLEGSAVTLAVGTDVPRVPTAAGVPRGAASSA